MATYTDVTFKINDEHLQRFIDGIAGHFGYEETDVDGEPNTETKAAYGKRKLRQQLVLWVKSFEQQEAQKLLDTQPIDVT